MSPGMRPKYVAGAATGGESVQLRSARVELVLYVLRHSQKRLVAGDAG